MSSPRVQKMFQAAPDQLKRLGGYAGAASASIRWAGRAASGSEAGKDAVLIDFDGLSWATGQKRAILVATPAHDQNDTAAMKTQSHASGTFIDGSVSFTMYMEAPADHTGAHAQFLQHLMHHLRGQLAAPVNLKICANATEPTIQGVNGAGASATYVDGGMHLPYGGGSAYPGGI